MPPSATQDACVYYVTITLAMKSFRITSALAIRVFPTTPNPQVLSSRLSDERDGLQGLLKHHDLVPAQIDALGLSQIRYYITADGRSAPSYLSREPSSIVTNPLPRERAQSWGSNDCKEPRTDPSKGLWLLADNCIYSPPIHDSCMSDQVGWL